MGGWAINVARSAGGIPLAVYKLDFMIIDRQGRVGNPGDFMWRLLKECISTGVSPLLPSDRKELIPVDYASKALIHRASDNSRLGRMYHLIFLSDELYQSKFLL